MEMGDIGPGVLVSFCPVETGVDVVHPVGTNTKSGVERLIPGMHYEPKPGERGLVVAGPEWNSGGNLKLWLVLVASGNWWFPDDCLVNLDVQ
jgi:hypothetical protein